MQYGLKDTELDGIKEVFAGNSRIEKAILFGSRAKGNFKPGSDADIAISGSELKLDDLLKLKVLIDEFNLPYNVDLLIYEKIKDPDVIEHINRVGVLIYKIDK